MKLEKFQIQIKYLEEPKVEVGANIPLPEVKMGWTLLGPLDKEPKKYELNLALVGDAESIDKTKDMLERMNVNTRGKGAGFLHVDFPGLAKLRIKVNILCAMEIDEEKAKTQLEKAESISDRVSIAAQIISEKITAISNREPTPDVIIVSYPRIIDSYCIQGLIGKRGTIRKTAQERKIEELRSSNRTLYKWIGIEEPRPKEIFRDLRSLIKAKCMKCDIPVQIVRPATTEEYNPERPRHEDDATLFWNLTVALFYKSNHLPWRAQGLSDDACYIGISFFRDKDDAANVKTSLAQVFSLDNEGFVFKGNRAIIDESKAPHVSKQDAIRLIQQAVETYKANKTHVPERIVVHKTSRYTNDEIEGFKIGANGIKKIDLIAFGVRGIKLMRWGMNPPIRGTMVKLPDNSVLLYTFGYIPYLGLYPGPRVPSPLEILEYHGKTHMDTICKEILALTKLDWNNAKFCIKAPVTIAFARRVGTIIRESRLNPSDIKEKFKFYM